MGILAKGKDKVLEVVLQFTFFGEKSYSSASHFTHPDSNKTSKADAAAQHGRQSEKTEHVHLRSCALQPSNGN